jgi:peptide/nickel transport system substrate-binding protein
LERIVTASSALPSADVVRDSRAPTVIRPQKHLTIPLVNDPLDLHPEQITDAESHQVVYNFSVGLFQFGDGVDIIPGLCRDYTVSQDGREYLFTIRRDLKYQNGKPVRIEDFQRAILKALQGPNRSFLDMITDSHESTLRELQKSKGIEVINRETLKITLNYPYLPILANLASNIADPYIEGELPIGAGPFRILDWEKGDKIVFEANNHYFEGQPSVDVLTMLIVKDENLQYELFKNRSLSVFHPRGEVLKKIRAEMPHLLHTIPELNIEYLCFNCQKEPFTKREVRQAFAHAINIKELVKTRLKDSAVVAKGIFPPSMSVYNPKLEGYLFDPDISKQLLSDAGFPGGLPDRYILDTSDAEETMQCAEFIKSNLKAIGVQVDINPMPWDELTYKIYAGESTLSLDGWVGDNGDPDNFVYPLFHSSSHGHSGNTFFFSSHDIDHDLDYARKIRNTNQRISFYQMIEEKIIAEAPGIFLYHGLQNIAIHNDVLGMKPHPLGLLRIKYVYPSHSRKLVRGYNSDRKARQRNSAPFTS